MGDQVAIKDVFLHCQTGLQGHGKLIKALDKTYGKTDIESFWPHFCHCLKYAMVVFKREPAVERVIDFVAKFVTSLSKKSDEDKEEKDEDDEDSVEDNHLLKKMFDFLLDSHSACDRAVRFRTCQLINKLLVNLGDDAQIDDDLYDRLYECMLERLKDKCPVVRYHAVLAMARLQDPSDENCPVIKADLFLMNCDPNPDVRRAVLQSIAPSTKTLASIVGRTRDVKDTVRKTAYIIISEKIHIKALSIALRLQILNEGLNDRSEVVRQACSGKLLQAWLRTLDGKILELLRSLDVEDSTEICCKVLETLYKASSVGSIVDGFDLLDNDLLIPEDKLTSEAALYWQSVCKYLHSLGTEGEEYIEKVLPNCVSFCTFVQRYVDDLKNVDDPEIQLNREFIIEQLLLIASYMDTADSASRRALEQLLHNMLMADCISHRLVKPIIKRVCELKGTRENIMQYIAETVAEIREPITIVEKDIEAEQKRQTNLKIAGIRVQLNQLREDLEEAVRSENFSQAAEIKTQVAELDAEKARLLEDNEPMREEVRTERTDPETLLKCMTIVSEVLQVAELSGVSPTLQMMIESQIVPGIQNEIAEVRNMAMEVLGLCCYMSKDLLFTYMPLFMQASKIDVELVRVTALKILFDVLLIFGLEEVAASDSSPATSDGQPSDSSDSNDAQTADSVQTGDSVQNGDATHNTASKMVAIISSFLDGESSELRMCAAEGLAKLLLSGRVVSAKILSHLILLWYNPLSEDDTHLRDCLGTFFPIFALANRANQEVVEGAFLPTLRTLLNAPVNSPLAEVNVSNVAELLVQLTNSRLITSNLASGETNKDNPGHDNLLELVCNEILTDPTSPNVRLWVRIINQMEPTPDNEVVLKDLRVLCHKMVNLVKDKKILKSLQRFQTNVNQLASQFVSGDDDLADVDLQPVVQPVEEMEMEPQTPKRKRVRGLYSQSTNLTMELEVETDLDITADTTQDIDATCLMSRTSDAQNHLRNKSSVSELTAEDIIRVPDDVRKRASVKTVEVSGQDQVDNTDQSVDDEAVATPEDTAEETAQVIPESVETETRSRSPNKQLAGKKRSASMSPEKSERSAGKRARSEDFSKTLKQKNKSLAKRHSSTSPAGSPRKRSRSHGSVASSSKSPKNQTKSTSPAKKSGAKSTPKRTASKSPSSRSSSQTKKSKEPEKRSLTKSPVKEKSASKSPQKKTTSKSPEKRTSSKSPEKKSQPQSTRKPVSEINKKVASATTARQAASKLPEKLGAKQTEVRARHTSTRLTETKRLPSSTAQRLTSNRTAVKAPERNVRRTTPAASKPTTQKTAASKPAPASPRKTASKEKEMSASASSKKVADMKAAAKIYKSPRVSLIRVPEMKGTGSQKSPRSLLASSQSVAETPESQRSKRSALSQSVFSTPVTPTSRSTRGTPASTAGSGSRTRASLRQSVYVADTPSPQLKKKGETTPSQRPGTRVPARARQSTRETPEVKKAGQRGSKRKSDAVSSVSSVESVNDSQQSLSVSDEEEEEDVPLRRKARPSRKSIQSTVSTPGSQRSSDSPAARSSSRRSQAGGDTDESSQKHSSRSVSREASKGTKQATTATKSVKGRTVTSSPESSSKPSPRVSTRSTPKTTAPTRSLRGTPRASESDSVFSPPSSVRSARSSQLTTKASQSTTARSSQSSTTSSIPAARKVNRATTVTESRQTVGRGQRSAIPARSARSRSDRN